MGIPTDVPKGLFVPSAEAATVAIHPTGAGRGHWAGAPSAWRDGDAVYLAYRIRRPEGGDRGFGVVVARSADGVAFETLGVLGKESFGAASLERPALVQKPDGSWRIYVSCATPGSDHWWIDAIDGAHPGAFDPATRRTVLAGDDSVAVKDPVVQLREGTWMIWVCCHPLDDPDATDRMYTTFATSADGLAWSFEGDPLRGTAGRWDARGARVADVLYDGTRWVAYYDGRSSKEDNAEELTGVAVGATPGGLRSLDAGPLARSPWGSGSLRYVSVTWPHSGPPSRVYFEACLPDGSHALMTQLVDPAP